MDKVSALPKWLKPELKCKREEEAMQDLQASKIFRRSSHCISSTQKWTQ